MSEADGVGTNERLISMGLLIREARLRAGLTQPEVGPLMQRHGYRVAPSATRISKWENGRAPIPVLARPHLAAVLGIELPHE
jgi:transcriptional regulator with XRE-family HTH domain